MKKIFFLLFFSLFFALPVFAAYCGDLVCETAAGENKCTCPQDCGACTGSIPGQLCGYYTCDPTNMICQAITRHPCCGNSDCELGESFGNCPIDCAPKLLVVTPLGFDEAKHFLRGDTVVFKASVSGDGVPARQSNVTVTGVFGQLSLFDDGNHLDGKKDDAIYANSWAVGRNIEKDTYNITFNAEKLGSYATKTVKMIVDPALDFSVSLDKTQILLGDIVSLHGIVKRRNAPLVQAVSFSAIDENGNNINGFSQSVLTNSKGEFSFDYHTSLIEPIGEWTIKAESTDEFGNTGDFEKKVRVASAEKADFLDLSFLVPSQGVESVFERGEEIKIIADLKFEDNWLDGADVKATFGDKYSVNLSGFGSGKYSGKFEIPFDFPLGVVELKGIAFKTIEKTKYSGSTAARIIVQEAPIKIEVSEPTINVFALGETIGIVVSLKYPSNAPVTGVDLNSIASDGRQLNFKETSPGTYKSSLVVLDSDIKGLSVSIAAVDSFRNRGSKELPFEILETKSFWFYFISDPLLSLLLVLVFFVLLAIFIFLFRIRKHIGALEKRRKELVQLREELQENYFSRATIDKKEYYNLMTQYTGEMEKINATIDSLKRGKPVERQSPTQKAGQEKATPLEQEAEGKALELFSIEKKEQEKPKAKKKFFGFLKKKNSEEK